MGAWEPRPSPAGREWGPQRGGAKFIDLGLQTAAGVPLMCDEPEDFRTFRVGLFGLDKWLDVDGAVEHLRVALESVGNAG